MAARFAAAVRALRTGALVVYPTDTLFGLAARASDRGAVARLESVKARPAGQPTSVAVSSVSELEALVELAPRARRFVRTHLPGPYTVLARPTPLARRTLASALLARGGSLGLRVPDHPVARELARRAGPITATSANLHGRAPARTLEEARRALGERVGVYVDGPPRPTGVPSVLVDLARGTPRRVSRR